MTSRLADCGLTQVRFAALQKIAEAAPGGCSQAQLAVRLEQTESSVSTLVDRMRRDGLLYRLRSKVDRRKRVLMLTVRGRELFERAQKVYGVPAAGVLGSFSEQEQRLFASLLARLIEALCGAASSPLDKPGANEDPNSTKLPNQVDDRPTAA